MLEHFRLRVNVLTAVHVIVYETASGVHLLFAVLSVYLTAVILHRS